MTARKEDHRDITDHRRSQRHTPAGLRAGPPSALGPALNDQGYYVGRVERNLYWVTDVFIASTAFWVMESIRLDLGFASQVHP